MEIVHSVLVILRNFTAETSHESGENVINNYIYALFKVDGTYNRQIKEIIIDTVGYSANIANTQVWVNLPSELIMFST